MIIKYRGYEYIVYFKHPSGDIYVSRLESGQHRWIRGGQRWKVLN